MKLIGISGAVMVLTAGLLSTPAMAGSTNGFGVGTSAFTGQYLDTYGGVETNGAAYRMSQDSSLNYTRMGDVAPVNFDQCAIINAGAPGTCSATQGGTTGPGFDLTASNSNAYLNYSGGIADVSTYANLATGKLGATGHTSYYQTALSVAEFVDTLTFNVAGATASSTTDIIVKFQLDGGLFTPDAPLGTPGLGGRNASVQNVFSFGDGFGRVNFNQAGANPTYDIPATLTMGTNQSGWTSYSWDVLSTGMTQFTGVYTLSGISQILGIRNSLSAYAATGASFTYGNTSSLNFILPSNVTFTSASGTFLSGLTTGGAVPEPGTWAMMIFGFGLVGATMRRRGLAGASFA